MEKREGRKERKQAEKHQAKVPSPLELPRVTCDGQSPVGYKYPLINILLLLTKVYIFIV